MIQFTQYLMPHGRPVNVQIARPPEIERKAMALINAGLRLEAEVLSTGDVSLTVFNIDEEEDIAIEVVPNGPEVPPAVDRLIEFAFRVAGLEAAKT